MVLDMYIKVSICDDNAAERERIGSLVSEWASASGTDINLNEYCSAEEFLFSYEDCKPDILLLDVEMPGLNGVDLAKRLRASNRIIQIIFITAYSDYITEGYEVAALHYLLKPVEPEKLFRTLNRAVERVIRDCRSIALETVDGTVIVPLYEVRYLEACKNYVTVHAERDYTVRRTLSDFSDKLDSRFIKAGRSFIINLLWIKRVSKNEIELKNGEIIPIPKAAFETVNRAIINMK